MGAVWNSGLEAPALPLAGVTEDVFAQRVADTTTHAFTETWLSPLESISTGLNEALGAVPLVQIVWALGGALTARKGEWLPLYQSEYANTEQGFVAQFNAVDGGMMFGTWTVDWERRAATWLNGANLTVDRHDNRARWVEFGVFVNGVLCGRSGFLYPRRHVASIQVVTPVAAGLVRAELRMRASFAYPDTVPVGAVAPSTNGNRPPINVWASAFKLRTRYR